MLNLLLILDLVCFKDMIGGLDFFLQVYEEGPELPDKNQLIFKTFELGRLQLDLLSLFCLENVGVSLTLLSDIFQLLERLIPH